MREVEPCRIVLDGHPATKKNSARLRRYGCTVLLPSKAYMRYELHCRNQLAAVQRLQDLPHYEGPVRLVALYYLKSKAHWPDLLGLEQATADIISDEYKVINHRKMLAKEWLLSDDRIIKSWDGSKIAGIDKDNPRVEIWIYPLPMDVEAELDPKLRK